MSDHVEVIIKRVAEHENVEPLDIEKPLYEVVDSESLGKVVERGSAKVTFRYLGYRVVVAEDSVDVSPVKK